MNKNRKEILSILAKDLIKNINLINFIEQNEVVETHIIDNAVLVKGISDRTWVYFSCASENEFEKLLDLLTPEDKNFAVLEDWMIPILRRKFEIEVELSTIKYFLPNEITLPPNSIQIVELTPGDANYIYEHYDYRDYTDAGYIKQRIVKSISAGILKDDRLVAWAATHDDGAIGMLHVLPAYRRQGLAKEIMLAMINKLRKLGKLPFAQIEEDNFKSIKLVEGLGFIRDRQVSWASRKF